MAKKEKHKIELIVETPLGSNGKSYYSMTLNTGSFSQLVAESFMLNWCYNSRQKRWKETCEKKKEEWNKMSRWQKFKNFSKYSVYFADFDSKPIKNESIN